MKCPSHGLDMLPLPESQHCKCTVCFNENKGVNFIYPVDYLTEREAFLAIEKKAYVMEKLYNAEHLTKAREIKALKKEKQRLRAAAGKMANCFRRKSRQACLDFSEAEALAAYRAAVQEAISK